MFLLVIVSLIVTYCFSIYVVLTPEYEQWYQIVSLLFVIYWSYNIGNRIATYVIKKRIRIVESAMYELDDLLSRYEKIVKEYKETGEASEEKIVTE